MDLDRPVVSWFSSVKLNLCTLPIDVWRADTLFRSPLSRVKPLACCRDEAFSANLPLTFDFSDIRYVQYMYDSTTAQQRRAVSLRITANVEFDDGSFSTDCLSPVLRKWRVIKHSFKTRDAVCIFYVVIARYKKDDVCLVLKLAQFSTH